MEQEYTIDNSYLSPEAQKRKKELEENPASRTNHMEYMDGMEVLDSDIKDKVRAAMQSYDYNTYTDTDVCAALANAKQGHCDIEDFKALLSPAALPHLEEMAALAQKERLAHFGDCVYIFTPLYIANYCENYCVYCGFNCYNHIHRKKLTEAEMEAEMKVIADSGIEEILMLTGESRAASDVKYIGEACKLARKYFRNIGLEIYPVNTDEYHYLHECGADYITVFQETYNPDKYETLHLMGHKRVWPYRFDAQERALRGGMRVSDSPLCWGWMITTRMRLQLPCTSTTYSGNTHTQKCPFPVRVCVQSSTTTRSIQRMSMKMSSARSYALIGCSCLSQQSPFPPVRKPASVTASSVSPQRRFPQVYRPVSAITRRSTRRMTGQSLMLVRYVRMIVHRPIPG